MANPIGRIQAMNAQIVSIDAAIAQARAEHNMLVHIDDDAQRDAAVSGRYEDRADAKHTARDLARIEKYIASLINDQDRLIRRRDHEVARLAAG
ncbi:MAG: hypothetical protein ACC654_08185 [Acidimicrobiia bacterium]|jgi:hypothetical protein